MVEIDNYRLIILQFSFTNSGVVPQMIKNVGRETLYGYNIRKSRLTNGIMVIEPVENCSLSDFIEELKDAGYEMVDAFHQERINPKPYSMKTYHMVRFTFASHEFVNISDDFKKKRDDIYVALTEMCSTAMWRVRAFSNPFYKDGEEIHGQRVLSINMEARKPLFHPDGQPIMVWQKDENGRRIGSAPVQITPEYSLTLD